MKNPFPAANKISLLASLRYRNIRIFYIGLLGSVIGVQIQNFTKLWFVYELTGSPFYLGLTGGTLAISTIIFSFLGGILADRFNRRRLLMFTQTILGFIMFILATLIVLKVVNIWHVLVIAFFSGMVQAFDRPSREALIPNLIKDKKDLGSAIALSSSIWQMSRIVGPSIAGILISLGGASLSFYVSSFLYFCLILAVISLKMPKYISPMQESNMWRSFIEGLAHIYKSPLFSAIIGVTNPPASWGAF